MTEPAGSDTATNVSALADMFAHVGRDLVTYQSIDDVLGAITARAVRLVPSAEHAAISRGRDHRFETVAATDELPPQVDQIQYDLGSGPCMDAALEGCVFRIGDLPTSERWPEFGRRAAERYGVCSMLSVRIFLEDDDLLAGLNLYASDRDAFDESDQTTAMLLATHGALAFTAARRQSKIDNLERALKTSRQIGVAIGILMANHKVTDQQAFDLLRIASQASHRKLHDIADEVMTTGTLSLPPEPTPRSRDDAD